MLYLQFHGASLSHSVGQNVADRFRVSTGEQGHLCFGPYVSADPGQYVAGFYIRRIGEPNSGDMTMDVFVDCQEVLALRHLKHAELFDDVATFVSLPFTLDRRADCIEARIFVGTDVTIEVQELVLFSTDQRVWSGK